MHSCLYQGVVTHHRRDPVDHRFRYGLVMAYLDLAETPRLVGRDGVLSDRRWAVGSFLREDRLFRSAIPLDEEVRGLIADATGEAPAGPIRLLTQLRWFGYYFSPLNLYYVFDKGGDRVEHVVAEVNNTPWGERHVYLLTESNSERRRGEDLRFRHAKEFHVSPFMDMDADYRWRLGVPAERLNVSLAREAPGERSFNANLTLRRQPLTRASVRRAALRYPFMTAQVSAAIYFEALRLWWKRCPYYPHPDRQPPNREGSPATHG